MADPAGEFTLNHTGNGYAKNDDGVVVAYANYEGIATGFMHGQGTDRVAVTGTGCCLRHVHMDGSGVPTRPGTVYQLWRGYLGTGRWQSCLEDQ